MDQDRALEPGARLELGQQPVDVVDVPRALDLRDHHDLELVADLGHQRRQIVERPWRLEAVDPGPERRRAEVDLLADPDQPLARRQLAVDGHGVLEVAEQNVGLSGEVGQLGGHLLVARIEEMDHPRRLDRDLEDRRRRADRKRLSEVAGVSHGLFSWSGGPKASAFDARFGFDTADELVGSMGIAVVQLRAASAA